MLLGEPLYFRRAIDFALEVLRKQFDPNSQASQQRGHDTVRLLDQSFQQVQRLDGLVLVARGDFLRFLNGLLRLHGHLVKTKHVPSQTLSSKERGRRAASPICYPTAQCADWSIADYLVAAAAMAGGLTLTLICLGLASSRFGTVSVRTPSLYSALMASEFTVLASEKLRLKEP